MFVKRRKTVNVNNNDLFDNNNYKNLNNFNENFLKSYCFRHKDCDGHRSPEVCFL